MNTICIELARIWSLIPYYYFKREAFLVLPDKNFLTQKIKQLAYMVYTTVTPTYFHLKSMKTTFNNKFLKYKFIYTSPHSCIKEWLSGGQMCTKSHFLCSLDTAIKINRVGRSGIWCKLWDCAEKFSFVLENMFQTNPTWHLPTI